MKKTSFYSICILSSKLVIGAVVLNDLETKPSGKISSLTCVNPDGSIHQDFYAFMNHFNGIFIEDFITGGHQTISGPLAVGGTFISPYCTINPSSHNNCRSNDAVSRLGLYAESIESPANIVIAGDIVSRDSPRFQKLINIDSKCKQAPISTTRGLFTFDIIQKNAISISKFLQIQVPTHVLTSTDVINKLYNSPDQRFWVLNFRICPSGSSCTVNMDTDSYANNIFFSNNSQWIGPINGYPTDRIIVFNVGVVPGSDIAITTPKPNAGLPACRAIFNFYPILYTVPSVNPTSEKLPINLYRRTSDVWGGLIMNLYGPAYDGSVGNYGGQLIALSYSWENLAYGSDILDYNALGESCYGQFPCWVPTNMTTTVTTEIKTAYVTSSIPITKTLLSTTLETTGTETRTVATRTTTEAIFTTESSMSTVIQLDTTTSFTNITTTKNIFTTTTTTNTNIIPTRSTLLTTILSTVYNPVTRTIELPHITSYSTIRKTNVRTKLLPVTFTVKKKEK